MPIYEYEHDEQPAPPCQLRFEVIQRMHEEPLSRCPACGAPCHRVFSSFATSVGRSGLLSPKNLERHGFTQYRKAGGGYYEKTCGEGPELLKRG